MISVIIPVYNEGNLIVECLSSLSKQTECDLEIIVVDDGSKDSSKFKVQSLKLELKIKNLTILNQKHQGPGVARNMGAKYATGDILVFVDADMTFDSNFIRNLIIPIQKSTAIGTFSRDEFLLNPDKIWSKCWNINRYLLNHWKLDKSTEKRMLPPDYPDTQPVFRAILKKEFERAGGFDNIGYTDDWTLSRKLGKTAVSAPGAIYFHRNPETIQEISIQAEWIGGNEFISGSIVRKYFNLVRYSVISSLVFGIYISFKFRLPEFILFKLVYDANISSAILKSFFGVNPKKLK